jgi:hypothetical protein
MRRPAFHPSLFRDKRNFSYFVRSGIQDARLDGKIIRGQFQLELVERLGEPRGLLAEQFVNLPSDPASVLLFTKANGPIDYNVAPGSKFSFDIKSFTRAQEHFRKMWRKPEDFPECPMDGGGMRFSNDVIEYRAGNLRSFLHFDLQASHPTRLRVCKAEGCSHPYFIAGDLKRKFCSVECSEEGRRELKREWWQKNGQAWEANRRSAVEDGAEESPQQEVEDLTH